MNNIFLAVAGFTGGTAVAAGAFALIVSLGIVPRMAGKTSLAAYSIQLENALICGGIFGMILALLEEFPFHLGKGFAMLYGVSSGIFAGCLAVALAEVLNVFPVMFRRMHLKKGLKILVTAFAFGKAAGALYYFGVLFR